MRKLLIGAAALAAIATPLVATAGSADAATAGTGDMHFVTHYQGVDYVHDAAATYTCDGAGNVNFTFIGRTPRGPATARAPSLQRW